MSLSENDLVALIRGEIGAAGPISCARYMQFALYHPVHGYYQQRSQQIGCQGDFYTSVSVGPLFGQLLAFFFASRFEALDPHESIHSIHIVEAGAHDGTLARDILSCLEMRRPGLASAVQYLILEPSDMRREIQAQTLSAYRTKVTWVQDWEVIAPGSLRGVIFANELLDAFPALRLGWDARNRRWFEWRVDWSGDRFVWIRARPDGVALAELTRAPWRELPERLLAVLPDGFTVEVAPPAGRWWEQAAARLGQGSLMTLDYGLDWVERFDPGRRNGTLRTYRQHRAADDPLVEPGRLDLTTHVDFSELIRAGEAAGLTTSEYCTQSTFLTRILRAALAQPAWLREWTEARTRQFKTLTHPNLLGTAFRVLEQRRSP